MEKVGAGAGLGSVGKEEGEARGDEWEGLGEEKPG